MATCDVQKVDAAHASHQFVGSRALRRRLESGVGKEAFKSAAPRGIVEENDHIARFGFTLAGGIVELPPVDGVVVNATAGTAGVAAVPRFTTTEFCVADIDTLSAALVLGDAVALNFANATVPGGRYRSGGRAQEEDLCRLLPQLYPSLARAAHRGVYPIAASAALLSPGLLAVRRVGTYALMASQGTVDIVTAAMPCGWGNGRRPRGGWLQSPWATTVALRIRAVLAAAVASGRANLVLGAFGCGAFGNPAAPVAAIFREVLASSEFRGAFARVCFAIIDPLGTGNLAPFRTELARLSNY